MIRFIIGAILGNMLGITFMCLCAAAREADRRIQQEEMI